METSTLLRRLPTYSIKYARCVANFHLNSRSYQSVVATVSNDDASSENTNWRKYHLQRFYSQSPNQTDCWHCKAKTTKLNRFICSECGKLQDITEEYDYFQLLSLPRNFDVPASKLTKIFRQLQTLVHPDKFSNKSEREQRNSAEWSAIINKAYKTLSQPIVRGQYLLKLQGEEMPNDNSSLNKEFLMEMMERNEEVDEANTVEDLSEMNDKIQREINAEIMQLKGLFSSSDLQGAKEKLVKTKYLLSIQSSIKTKLEKLMNR